MDLVIVGMGRAGGSLARAATLAGHRLTGVLTRRAAPGYPALEWDRPLPTCDLVLIAVTDGAISEVGERLARHWREGVPAVHLSGFVSVEALRSLSDIGAEVGSFHPLQTLPDPERGARSLTGAHAAITTSDDGLASLLERLASSVGMRPFHLADSAKPLYHAAASAAANYVVEALGVAEDLLAAAGIDPMVMQPLTSQVVDNVNSDGAASSLTGPVARGDKETVSGQIRAAASVSPALGEQFELLARATAIRAGVEL